MAEAKKSEGGSGMYIGGVVLLGAGIAAIVFLTKGDEKAPPAPPPPVTAEQATQPALPAPPPPPPPPPTATASAAPETTTASTGKVGAGGPNPCTKCGEGVSNSSLNGALQGAAGSARGCYNRALQRNAGAAGKMTVVVQVGPSGQVCGASIAGDTVGSPEVSSCVLCRFHGRSFRRPDGSRVTVNIPLSFEVKQ